MLARLILLLLVTAFALPALANGPCHDAPTVMAAAHHATHGAADDRAMAAHVCMGCIPPAGLASRAVTAPLRGAALPYRLAASAFTPRLGTPPAPPPPRRDA